MFSLKEKLDSTYKIPKKLLQLSGSFPQENGEFRTHILYFINVYMMFFTYMTFTEICTAWPNVTFIVIGVELLCIGVGGSLKFFSYTVRI